MSKEGFFTKLKKGYRGMKSDLENPDVSEIELKKKSIIPEKNMNANSFLPASGKSSLPIINRSRLYMITTVRLITIFMNVSGCIPVREEITAQRVGYVEKKYLNSK